MKFQRVSVLLMALILFASCGKLESSDDGSTSEVTDDQKILKGNFINASHPTSGEVFVYEEGNIKKLGFTNFKTDNGPDLRIYLAADLGAKNFVQVSGEVKNGTYSVEIPETANLGTQKYVLIWCKAFSVLFGSAELK